MSVDRERSVSRDRDGIVRHQTSFDLHGRTIPMWDSSDPDRAPPPLPLNPGVGSPQPTTRPNTSAHIAAAAQALADKARESAGPAPYTTNAMPERSPERSLIKGAAHRRMQSLQTPSVRDLRSYLDGSRSPERSPERGRSGTVTPITIRDTGDMFSSPERNTSRAATPTPTSRDLLNSTPSLRPTSRPPPKAILGENTPPSATMLALQTMPIKDYSDPPPLSHQTNGSLPRKADDIGAISTQILSLTTICTSLQREMASLSRRSKDNATDLVSLKDATNSRDEDIRKSLRELVQNLNLGSSTNGLFGSSLPRATANHGHSTPPPGGKSFTLPRIPSPSSIFDERVGSPSPFSMDGVASVAMLEKIIREMVTKDGQEHLLLTLSNLFDKASKDSGETAKKVDQMCQQIQKALANQASQALVPCNHPSSNEEASRIEQRSESGPLTRTTRDIQQSGTTGGQPGTTGDGQSSYTSPKAADFVGDEMIKLLKKIKESVGQTGGMVGEMKAQQRDLRGEVLHMGRDIARKIDESRKPASGARAIEDGSGKQDIARIVTEGLAELKQHLDNAMRDKRRSSSSTTLSRSSVNSQEVYDVVKHSLSSGGLDPVTTQHAFDSGLDKESILQAVKEAYEEYKPDVQVEQFGLERDEILDCLREGLDQYKPLANDHTRMSREEVMDAIHDAMKDYQPPPPINESNELRDEILMAVRECLDEFKPSLAVTRSPTPQDRNRELDVTREVVLDAVKAGLAASGPNAAREIEISRDDLFEAVKAGLESSGSPFGRYGEQVVNQLHGMVNEMRLEFKDYSTANGRDTEQVLDAMNDGLEKLRVDIEQYVDRAQDVTSKDEIIDTVSGGLENLRRDVEAYCAAGPQGENALRGPDLLSYMKAEFEHLHGAITNQLSLSNSSEDKYEILQAIQSGFESLQTNISNSRGFDGEGNDGVHEAMKAEFDQLREAVIGGSSVHKDEVIDTLQSGFDTIHGKIDGGAFASVSSDDDIRAIKEELEHLRSALVSTMTRSNGEGSNEEVMDAVRELREMVSALPQDQAMTSPDVGSIQVALETLREQLGSDNGATSKEVLDTIQSEFVHLRETLGGTIVRSGSGEEKDEILDALRSTLDTVQTLANRPPGSIDEELLGAIRGEFEVLRSSINTGFSRSTQRADMEDVMDAVRLGFDDLRSELVKRIENPEQHMKATSDLLDALNEGLESLKNDVGSTVSKPIDMTVSYEILDTLKEGIASLRADLSTLKGNSTSSEPATERGVALSNQVVLAENEPPASREMPPAVSTEVLSPNDLQKIEVMLAQLEIKVDAMDANISDQAFRPREKEPAQPAEGTALKVDLESIENLIKEMQGTIDVIAARDLDTSSAARKEDTDAIETLLRNTKAKLDELHLPDPATVATKEQIECVETLLRSTREAIDDLSVRVDDSTASKSDMATVEALVQELKTAMDDVKTSRFIEESRDSEKVKRTDVDAVAMIALEIRDKVNAMHNLEPEALPSKADVEQLTGLIHDFRDSHEKLKENYENDVQITAKAFDDRKQEAEDTILAIGMVKSYLSDVKDELKSRLDVAALETTTLVDNFKILEKTIESNFNVTADVKELMETVNREFERIHGTVEDVKMFTAQKTAEDNEKHSEAKTAVISEISMKLDEKFDVIMTKYDEAQSAAEAQIKTMEEKTAEHDAILATTKEVSEELKLSVDTLGMTITAMEARFSEIMEKVNEDSQTVFNKMEEGFTKLEDVETRTAAKDEHQLTRDEIARAMEAINGVSAEATEFHPKFMVTLQEVVALINQNHEESQKAQESAQEQVKVAHEQSRSLTDEIKSSFSTLPALLPAPPIVPGPVEKYDDTQVQEKLDQLMGHVTESREAINQLDRLDKIHEQVMATAAEVSQFVNSQTRLITEGHESKQREIEDMALLLERQIADKEHLDKDIQELSSEKESLMAAIEILRSERDVLAAQKAKLASNVAALETANAIRKEELHAMDSKADVLERRILEGIMNQSRVMMMAKSNGRAAQQELTRMASNMSHSTVGQLPPYIAATQGLSMALKARQSPAARTGGTPTKIPTGRRVMSLNPITNNTPTGSHAYHAATPAASPGGLMKRSQSVRTPGMRKVSWNSLPDKEKRSISTSTHVEDKENSMISEEDSEDERDDYNRGDSISESGTERRMSHLTETTDAESGMPTSSYAGSVSEDDRPTSRGTATESGNEYMTSSEYTGSSYMTGSEITDRRTSYGSTVRSTLGADTVIDEEGENEGDEDAEAEEGAQDSQRGTECEGVEEQDIARLAQKKMVIYAAPSDSGLGSDLPTAAGMSGSETDYFRRKAEEGA